MACTDQWVDVFVTKSADDPRDRGTAQVKRFNNTTNAYETVPATGTLGTSYRFDDEFCCSVQSIEFDTEDVGGLNAYVTPHDSEWILPTWSADNEYGHADARLSAYSQIQVGDLIRVGGTSHVGFTDYLTVMEKREVKYLCNATNSKVHFQKSASSGVDGTNRLVVPTATSSTLNVTTSGNHVKVLSTSGIAHIALRVNAAIHCTNLPSTAVRRDQGEATHRQSTGSHFHSDLEHRQHAYEYLSDERLAYPGEDPGFASEKYYYPLYFAKRWVDNKELVAHLDHGVKQVAAVKLVGYKVANKRQVGVTHAHEMAADDFLILRIKEVDGRVISNNAYANGAFAILRSGDTSHNFVGASEFSVYEPTGIVCVPVRSSNNTMHNLTIEITDRLGNPAHFGRLHLWFKLLVTYG